MAGLNDSGKNALLTGLTSVVSHVSLHTADPGTTGTSEVSGGSYSRVAVSWAAASGGAVTNGSAIVFNVPGTTTINHLGYWSANTAGTFYGSVALDTEQTFATSGSYTIAIGNLSESIT